LRIAHPAAVAIRNALLVRQVRAQQQRELDMVRREQAATEMRLVQRLEAVGRMASGLAHELNTPIQFISDSLALVRDAYAELRSATDHAGDDLAFFDEAVPKAFERSVAGLDRIASLVRSLQELGAHEIGDRIAVDLNRVVEMAMTTTACDQRDVADVVVEYGVLPLVLCSGNAIGQVISSLIANATHAIAATGRRGTLRVSTRADGDHVCVEVDDDGVGIPEAIEDRIFEPFFTTKPVGHGTGQGLAMARSIIVDKHGGTLTFESTVGRGTRFRVRIPAGPG
jgi:signal transduction histidine kinase